MADSVRERICAYVLAQLMAAGGPAGLQGSRQRSLPIDGALLEDGPIAIVYCLKEEAKQVTQRASLTRRHLRFRVEVRAQAEATDTDLDPVLQWVVQQVMADLTMGGLVRTLEEIGTQWAAVTEDITVGAAAVDFEVAYHCRTQDLTAGN